MAERRRAPIVVGIDGSETGRHALEWALTEARLHQRPVQVVHVWAYEPVNDVLLSSSRQIHRESRELVRREIARVTEGMDELPTITQASIPGYPAGVLTEVSENAAMLVVGRHRGGVLRQALVGSVSSACVRRALCPVIVIPAAPRRRTNTVEI
ncbi:universal stress protein [Allokutzneria oryzae]|uniref:Universal stress protein n=1 Tax=Allokutzneria oryzae TaxID=1378989 RepID=A0ABV6A6U6_9PSEU